MLGRKRQVRVDQTGEMAGWMETLAPKIDNLGSNPGTHVIEEESQLQQL